jgi:hypothetical protein
MRATYTECRFVDKSENSYLAIPGPSSHGHSSACVAQSSCGGKRASFCPAASTRLTGPNLQAHTHTHTRMCVVRARIADANSLAPIVRSCEHQNHGAQPSSTHIHTHTHVCALYERGLRMQTL